MAVASGKSDLKRLLADAPAETFQGPHHSLLMVMRELGPSPSTGRLLRGLTPWLDTHGAHDVYLFTERKWREPWQDKGGVVAYQELVHWQRGPGGGKYRGAVWKNGVLAVDDVVHAFQLDPPSVVDYAARRMEAAVISSREPLHLEVHHEEKPWGREGWYTGIEQRGVSGVRSSSGSTELPYALGMFPVPLMGERVRAPILLKTLEPFPDEVYGDLYLEVHEEKWETYVVLEVHPGAWRDGVGELLAGLDPACIGRYRASHGDHWPDALTADMGARLEDYERVRREIDTRLDQLLRDRGEDPGLPAGPSLQRELRRHLPAPMAEKEARMRREVEAFLGKTPLRVGDVVALPPGVIHSLRHGIRVVEFQTPTYERLIAMFAQKVLTQSHWDSRSALARMEKAPYSFSPPGRQKMQGGCLVERAVSYPEFVVDRLRLEPDRTRQEPVQDAYHLLFVVEGAGRMVLPDGTSRPLVQDDAMIVPLQMGTYSMTTSRSAPLAWLKAVPREAPDDSVE